MKKRKSSQQDFDNPLANALKFDAADLDDNRSGFISHRQKRRLRNLSIGHETVWVGIGWALFMALGGVMFFGSTLEAIQNFDASANSFIVVGFGIVLSVFALAMIGTGLKIAYDHNRDTIRDLYTGKVAKVSGVTEHRIRTTKSSTFYYLRVGEELFQVSQWLQGQFEHEAIYTVYYAPRSRILLSGESGIAD